MREPELLCGDVVECLGELPAASVQCVVTSPPYWGLRSYLDAEDTNKHMELGSEPVPDCGRASQWLPCRECYVCHTVAWAREVHRVLRDDGTFWLNLGDSYNSGPSKGSRPGAGRAGGMVDKRAQRNRNGAYAPGLKPKDLCGIPWRVALALRADGWWLRSDIIWAKPNPMPESITDRPTRSHEFMFLLTKSGTPEYWTHPQKRGNRAKPAPDHFWRHKRTGIEISYPPVSERILKAFWTRHNKWRGHDYFYDADAVREDGVEHKGRAGTFARDGDVSEHIIPGQTAAEHRSDRTDRVPAGRNLRDVWWISPQPYKGSHYAVFPEKLVEPCVLAGTSAHGACVECGAPWERVVERTQPNVRDDTGRTKGLAHQRPTSPGAPPEKGWESISTTTDWRSTCGHDAEVVPCVVLDPFMGSGTTGVVAARHGRHFVGIDLDSRCIDQANKRIHSTQISIPLGLPYPTEMKEGKCDDR